MDKCLIMCVAVINSTGNGDSDNHMGQDFLQCVKYTLSYEMIIKPHKFMK